MSGGEAAGARELQLQKEKAGSACAAPHSGGKAGSAAGRPSPEQRRHQAAPGGPPAQGHSLWGAFPFFLRSLRSFCRRSSSASYIISWIRYFSLLMRSRRSFGRSGIR